MRVVFSVCCSKHKPPRFQAALLGLGYLPLGMCLEAETADLVIKLVSGTALHQHQNPTEQKLPVNSGGGDKVNHGTVPPWSSKGKMV